MTHEEARKNISAYVFMECENMPMQVIKALNVAREALEKEIPKKPKIMDSTLVGEKFWWYCGHCGASRHTNSKSNCCSYCGGKVNWNEAES